MNALDRMADLDDLSDAGAFDSWTAVVFSAMSFEAYLNESSEHIGMLSRHLPKDQESSTRLLDYYQKIKETEERKRWLTTQKKCKLASLAFTGKQWADDHPLYVETDLLLRLRNTLAHPKPDDGFFFDSAAGESVFRESALAQPLLDRGLIKVAEAKCPLTDRAGTKAVAKWAIGTADAARKVLNRSLHETLDAFGFATTTF